MTCPDAHLYLFTKWSVSLRCEAKRQWDQSAFALWAHNAWHKLAQRDISVRKISGFRRICLQFSASLHWLRLLLINKPACHFINPVLALHTYAHWNILGHGACLFNLTVTIYVIPITQIAAYVHVIIIGLCT